jgi:hypothetical protein
MGLMPWILAFKEVLMYKISKFMDKCRCIGCGNTSQAAKDMKLETAQNDPFNFM